MEIGNVTGERVTRAHREQGQKDLNNGACLKFNKVGCRPCKCAPSRVTHIEVNSEPDGENVTPSGLENE